MITRIGAFAIFVSLLLASDGLAQTQEASPEEVVAYQAFYVASQAGDTAKAMEAAQAYLKQFPEGGNVAYIRQWVAQARGGLFNQALKEGNLGELIRIGREQLAEKPDDLAYLLSLSVNLHKNVLLGSQREPEWEAAAGEFAHKAIALIEAGAVPPGSDPAKWRKETTLALLHQSAAIVANRGEKSDDALQRFETSLKLAPDVAGLASYNGFYCGKLRKDRYDAAVAAYKALPEESRTAADPPAEVQAALAEVNSQADAAIDCWAAFVGGTQKNNPFGEARASIEEALTALYATRHPDSPEGLGKLIAKYAER